MLAHKRTESSRRTSQLFLLTNCFRLPVHPPEGGRRLCSHLGALGQGFGLGQSFLEVEGFLMSFKWTVGCRATVFFMCACVRVSAHAQKSLWVLFQGWSLVPATVVALNCWSEQQVLMGWLSFVSHDSMNTSWWAKSASAPLGFMQSLDEFLKTAVVKGGIASGKFYLKWVFCRTPSGVSTYSFGHVLLGLMKFLYKRNKGFYHLS